MLSALLSLALHTAQIPAPVEVFPALERAMADAMIAKDRATLERLIDPAFVMRGDPDRDRTGWIDVAVTGCWGARVDLDGVTARVTGDAALVTLRSTLHIDPSTCAPAIVRSLITDAWRRDADGAWRLVMRHASAPGGLAAQYVRLDPPPQPVEGSAQVSYLTTRGNTRTGSLAGGLDATWRRSPWTTSGVVNGLRADADGEPKARKASAQVRAAREGRGRLSVFGRAGALRDRFSGIDSQVTVDAGASISLVPAGTHTLDVDLSAGYLDENRVAEPRKRSMIANVGARYHARIAPMITLAEAALAIVDVQEPGDWRLHNELRIDVAIRRWLSLGLSHTLDYRQRPIETFRGLDHALSTSLITHFGWS